MARVPDAVPPLGRLGDTPPHVRVLTNGRYRVVLTGAGAGQSSRDGVALTAWSGDRVEDGDGFFVYLRDLDGGAVWSAGHQPVRHAADRYEATYEPGVVRISRLDTGIATELTVAVAPEDDLEVRRLVLENRGTRERRIEVTTYAEVVLLDPAAYAAHPAFVKLFVQTEIEAADELLLAQRRARSADERHPWLVHACSVAGGRACESQRGQYETDRVRFVGRGHTLAAPRALQADNPLSGTVGSVLDPIMSFRRVVRLPPGGRATVIALLGAAESRAEAVAMAHRHLLADDTAATFAAAAERERDLLRSLGLGERRAAYLQALAGAMLYGDGRLRTPARVLRRASGSPALLTEYGIRRDALLVVARATDGGTPLLRSLISAQAYWQTRGLSSDVVVWCETATRARALQRIVESAAGSQDVHVLVRVARTIPAAHRDAIEACAHLVVGDALPSLADGAPRLRGRRGRERAASPSMNGPIPGPAPPETAPPSNAAHRDGSSPAIGAFSPDGREYVLALTLGRVAPIDPPLMPWVNVIANERFGMLVSERGAACTWSQNSRENRLTPWLNDPVCDPYGEALYLRDTETDAVWSPLPGPVSSPGASFEIRHGLGYSVWRLRHDELEHEVTMFVPQVPADPVKLTRLRLTNASDRPRRLMLFAYYRLVLGVLPSVSGRFVVSERDAATGALFARNRLNDEFAGAVVFAAAIGDRRATPRAGGGRATRVGVGGDRAAFLGPSGTPAVPDAVLHGALDETVGAGLDPCAALQITFDVPPHGTTEWTVLLGEAPSAAKARALIRRYRAPGAVARAFDAARTFWEDLCAGVQIATPVAALDQMVNAWLPYQILSCRIWGRSAFYQSGGAFGFRDQLQDAAAFALTRPSLTRAQILLHAAHQFVEGDVLHWWHPPTSKGIRTRFSDDLLWLPFLTAHYVQVTGDTGILDEVVEFVTARALAPGEDEAFLLPGRADERADVYAHCCRALDRSLTAGAHGLPLMGTGDWNDGMNRVGREGRGESVWLAFFLHRILDDFVPLCERRGDVARVQRYRGYQARLRDALEGPAWDGEWYRRAYYDDGTPLGSASNQECRIDALAQAWAVLSGAAPRARAAQAIDAVERLLIDEGHGLIHLLAPPFDRDPHDPGYIKGYLPGIRENGGQYTHAAVWVVEAIAELGRRDRAARLLAMLSPVTHGETPARVATYQVEPYVVAADVYGVAPHLGRGGWTWYTGSAGWMYRVAIESILGVRLTAGTTLVIAPRIPDAWPGFTVRLRLPDGGDYEIVVTNPTGCAAVVTAVVVDGTAGPVVDGAARIRLGAAGTRHRIEVTLGTTS